MRLRWLPSAGIRFKVSWVGNHDIRRAPPVALHPAVAVQHRTVRLTNRDSFAWQQVRLALNARVPGDGYTLDLPHLAAGALVELTRFTARDGSSFTPQTAKAFLLSLEADTPHGRGVWSGRID